MARAGAVRANVFPGGSCTCRRFVAGVRRGTYRFVRWRVPIVDTHLRATTAADRRPRDWFVADSSLEGTGFEPLVPAVRDGHENSVGLRGHSGWCLVELL
jgi:hypothetical protein